MKNKSTLFIGLLLFTSTIAIGQPGSLDGDFDADGKVSTNFPGNDNFAIGAAIQQDGKIVVCGGSGNGTSSKYAVARYHPDGSLDVTFGTSGRVTTVLENVGFGDYATCVAVQQDGKIVVAGVSDLNFGVLRYNSDGSIDSSFASNGIVITSFNGDENLTSMVIQVDGKIVVAGYTSTSIFNSDFAIARYNTDGTLDNTFSFDGKITSDFGNSTDQGYSVSLQSDGKIFIAGSSRDGFSDNDFAAVRYNVDGTLDNTFGTNGKVLTDFSNRNDYGQSAVIQPDQKIVVAGYSRDNEGEDFALLRYNVNGSLDSTFGFNGLTITGVGFDKSSAYSTTLQVDGKILVAGESFDTDKDFALARYNFDGSRDLTFSSGAVSTDFGADDVAKSVLVQPDGKILLVGMAGASPNRNFVLARYLSGLNVGIVNFSIKPSSPIIYPNPISHTAQLEFELVKDEVIDVLLYDMNGKLVQSIMRNVQTQKGQNKVALNFNNSITAGNYLLVISSSVGKNGIKIIIE
jgi:uncharacterized delta-60 repeat protein